MRRINYFIILVISFVFIVSIIIKTNNVYAMNNYEYNYSSNVSLEEHFADDRVLVILSEEASLSSKIYNISDFPNIRCSNVKELTIKDINQIRSTNNNEAKRVLSIELENSSKSYVLYVIDELIQREDVLYAGPDYEISVGESTYESETNVKQWAIDDLQLPLAWNFTTGSNNVLVGVIDSGIDGSHHDLESSIVNNMCRDFSTGSEVVVTHPIDPDGHGTNVAGVIGAIENNSLSCIGVNWNISIVSLKVVNNRNTTLSSNVATAIKYAEENNIKILNLSLIWKHGSTMYNEPLEEIIRSYSGLVICAAGNEGIDNDGTDAAYPASYSLENIISVGAYDYNHDRSIWKNSESSNFGSNSVDIFAPGSNIYTTDLNDGYNYVDGTSIATPHVTGVAALLLSLNNNLTTAQLKEAILNSADTIIIDVPDTSITAESDDTISQEVLKLNGYNAVKYVLEHFSNIEYNLSDSNYFINTNNKITFKEK